MCHFTVVEWIFNGGKRSIISVFCSLLSCAIGIVRCESMKIHQGTEQEDIFQFSRFHRKRDGCTRIDSGMLESQAVRVLLIF